MRPLRPGQDTVLSWPGGAVDCHVVAAAGAFVLLRANGVSSLGEDLFTGGCSLTFLDGMIPMGWDGSVEFGAEPGELRFRVSEGAGADRRSSVRLPIFATVSVAAAGGERLRGQMLDISAGGMRFRQPGQLATGTLVHLRAELPGGPTVEAHAVVRKSEPGVTAVEYTAMHDASAQDVGAWTVAQLRAALPSRA